MLIFPPINDANIVQDLSSSELQLELSEIYQISVLARNSIGYSMPSEAKVYIHTRNIEPGKILQLTN